MNGRITIFGYGPTGRAIAERLSAEGREITIAQRSKPEAAPRGAAFKACEALDGESVLAAARGSAQIVVAIGMPYEGKLWREAWPKAIGNFVAACAATGARMVFIDNLYMYGPQTVPFVETMPLTSYGVKPAARSSGDPDLDGGRGAGPGAGRGSARPDFYGPDVRLAYLGDSTIGALAKGRPASWVGSPDIPHDYAYVPDIARAAAALSTRPTRRSVRPGTSRARRPARRARSCRSRRTRSASRSASARCPPRCSRRSASSRPSCARCARCASSGIGHIGSMRANSRARSHPTPRRSRQACATPRFHSARAPPPAGRVRPAPASPRIRRARTRPRKSRR